MINKLPDVELDQSSRSIDIYCRADNLSQNKGNYIGSLGVTDLLVSTTSSRAFQGFINERYRKTMKSVIMAIQC